MLDQCPLLLEFMNLLEKRDKKYLIGASKIIEINP